MFGSGKRWSAVEYTHRKCLTIDISMMFFVSFSLIFLFAFSSPLFFSSLASCFSSAGNLVGFILVQRCRYQLTFQVAGYFAISRRGIVHWQGSSFCSIIFLLFPIKVAGKIPGPRVQQQPCWWEKLLGMLIGPQDQMEGEVGGQWKKIFMQIFGSLCFMAAKKVTFKVYKIYFVFFVTQFWGFLGI